MLLNYDVNTARKKLVYHSNTEGQLIPLIPLLEATATPAFETHCSFSSNFFFPWGRRYNIIMFCYSKLFCSVYLYRCINGTLKHVVLPVPSWFWRQGNELLRLLWLIADCTCILSLLEVYLTCWIYIKFQNSDLQILLNMVWSKRAEGTVHEQFSSEDDPF